MMVLSGLSTGELAAGICLRAGRIAAAEAELLLWVGEFDRREGWAGSGLLSCAHWLSWRVGLSLPAAREQVRVARRLPELPEVAAAFADGRVSYSKVRAITRVAEPDDGIDWVELARCSTAAQLEKLVRGVRRARFVELAEADPEAAAWQLRTRVRYDEHGNFSYTVSGLAELLPVVQAGIEAKKAELQRQRDAELAAAPEEVSEAAETEEATEDVSAEAPAPDSAPDPAPEPNDLDEQAPGWPAGTTRRQVLASMDGFAAASESRFRQWQDAEGIAVADDPAALGGASAETPIDPGPALRDVSAETSAAARVSDADALLALAQDALAAELQAHPSIGRRRRAQLTAQVDPLSGWARLPDGELLPPSSLKQILKTLPGRGGALRLRPLTDADLRAQDLGRSSREVSPALRELLGNVDGERCRMPGCTRRKKLHGHNVRYWSDGGPTDLANLVKREYVPRQRLAQEADPASELIGYKWSGLPSRPSVPVRPVGRASPQRCQQRSHRPAGGAWITRTGIRCGAQLRTALYRHIGERRPLKVGELTQADAGASVLSGRSRSGVDRIDQPAAYLRQGSPQLLGRSGHRRAERCRQRRRGS